MIGSLFCNYNLLIIDTTFLFLYWSLDIITIAMLTNIWLVICIILSAGLYTRILHRWDNVLA